MDDEINRLDSSLMMVIKNGVLTFALIIDTDVVTTELVGEDRTGKTEASRVVDDLTACQYPLP